MKGLKLPDWAGTFLVKTWFWLIPFLWAAFLVPILTLSLSMLERGMPLLGMVLATVGGLAWMLFGGYVYLAFILAALFARTSKQDLLTLITGVVVVIALTEYDES